MMPHVFPLDDLASQYITQAFPSLTAAQLALGHRTLVSFVQGEIPLIVARKTFQDKFGNSEPVDRMKIILDVPDEPIPPPEPGDRDSGRRKPRQWSQLEDQRLIAGLHRFGSDNWSRIAKFIGNDRTRSQTSQRWQRGLDPRLSRDHWTKEQENQLLRLVDRYGLKSWIKIAKDLGNRSDVQCRYRYKQIRSKMPHARADDGRAEAADGETDDTDSGVLDRFLRETEESFARNPEFGSPVSSFLDLPW
jgi:hypothetical protein